MGMVKIVAIQARSIQYMHNEKLSPKYFGPFKILSKIGHVANRLQLLT